MTRAEKVAIAQAYRKRGLTQREIGERMGVSVKTVNAWLCDPDLSKQRARRESYRGTCVDCGAATDGSAGPGKAPVRCINCNGVLQGRTNAESWRPHRELVERLWAEGLTSREIAKRLGWNAKRPGMMISTLRARGYNLPHRYSDDRIARMTRGSDERLAKARAVYREQRAA